MARIGATVNDYISVNSNQINNLSEFSIAFWLNWTASTPAFPFAHRNSDSSNWNKQFVVNAAAGIVIFQFQIRLTTVLAQISTNAISFAAGVWHHYVLT